MKMILVWIFLSAVQHVELNEMHLRPVFFLSRSIRLSYLIRSRKEKREKKNKKRRKTSKKKCKQNRLLHILLTLKFDQYIR